jgi:signal-transduction protein with cAMP-binding, CBS, and nucleotidyltransferase domain
MSLAANAEKRVSGRRWTQCTPSSTLLLTKPSRPARQRVAGIISERDIIRVLADRGAAALEQAVEQVMTHKLVTCSRAATISSVMELMTAGKFRHLPVVEEGRLIGIVLIGDVVKASRAGVRIRDLA